MAESLLPPSPASQPDDSSESPSTSVGVRFWLGGLLALSLALAIAREVYAVELGVLAVVIAVVIALQLTGLGLMGSWIRRP